MAVKRMREEENPNKVAKLVKTTSFGVCTRAKTMALKGSMLSRAAPNVMGETKVDINVGDGYYLHLRSRRLERLPPLLVKKSRKTKYGIKKKGFDLDEKENVVVFKFEEKHTNKEKIALGDNEGENRMVEKHETRRFIKRDEMINKSEDQKNIDYDDKVVEDSCGENDLDFGNKERNSRESTPSRLMEMSSTRMSSNKGSTLTLVKQMKIEKPIKPGLQELELFFADAEKHRIQIFINNK